tara:strand:- start:7079 stop:7900 length:822 start_codon:yes stop_codon:yes gene_type:complete
MKKNIGIIGNGFVGESQAFALSPVSNVLIYDIDPLKSNASLNDVHGCDIVFVCVPTPMYKDGSQDLSYILNVFKNAKEKPIYVIKSTVLPGTTKMIQNKYSKLSIIFSPEFLSERTAKLDVLTQSRIILGGDFKLTKIVKDFLETRFMNRNYIQTDSITAELVKYMNNTFFATKVSIMNEFKLIADKVGANWEDALNGFVSDSRVGDSHLHVPGPDGKLGYGGTCFPKDVNALILFAKKNGVDLNSIEGGWKTNLMVRQEKDWEKKKGRAVSE